MPKSPLPLTAPAAVPLTARLSGIGEALREIAALNDDINARRETLIQSREKLEFLGRPKEEAVAEVCAGIDAIRETWLFHEGRGRFLGTHFVNSNATNRRDFALALLESTTNRGAPDVRALIAMLAAPLKVAMAAEIEALEEWPEAMPTAARLAEIARLDVALAALDAEQAELQRAIDDSGLTFDTTPEVLEPLPPDPAAAAVREPKALPGWDADRVGHVWGPKDPDDRVTITRTAPEADPEAAFRMPPAPQGLMPIYRKDFD